MRKDSKNSGTGFGLKLFAYPCSKKLRVLFAVAWICLAGLTLMVKGQSGRRLPKASAPVPEATPETKPPEKKDDEKAWVNIILGINGRQTSFNIPLYYYDSVLASCADKLRDAPSVKLDVTRRDMNRGEAVKLAKSQKVAYVAWLELRSEGMGMSSSYPDSGEVSIEYVVFSPQTAKVVTSGRTYPRAFRKGGVVMGPGTGRTSTIYAERLLKQAASDAAERILSALHLIIPGRAIPPIAGSGPPQPLHKSD
jgi:hypothetical protein